MIVQFQLFILTAAMNTDMSVLVVKRDVPTYLASSPLLATFDDADESGFTVPADCIKPDTSINSTADFMCLLKTLRYWMMPHIILDFDSVVDFALVPQNEIDVAEAVESYGTAIPLLTHLQQLLECSHESLLKCAAELGSLALLKYLVLRNGAQWEGAECTIAACNGSLDCLVFAHENGCSWDETTSQGAVAHGNVHCLTYAHQHGCPCADNLCETASEHKQLPCLIYLHEHGFKWNYSVYAHAIINRDMNTLKYVLQERYDRRADPYGNYQDLCMWAVEQDNVEALQLLHEGGCPWSKYATSIAAKKGYLSCLQYLHHNGCPWHEDATYFAAAEGHLDCLEFAHENGCAWDSKLMREAAFNGDLGCLQYAHEHGCPWDIGTCNDAAMAGQIECLIYAYQHGCECSEFTCDRAVMGGKLDCLRYLHENGCPWRPEDTNGMMGIVNLSARRNRLDCLMYCIEEGCSLPSNVVYMAVMGGALECLRYLVALGCEQDPLAVLYSVDNGLVDCLQFLLDNGFPCSEQHCYTAAAAGEVGALRCLHEHGCPWHSETCKVAYNVQCYEYAVQNGCPGAELSKFYDASRP